MIKKFSKQSLKNDSWMKFYNFSSFRFYSNPPHLYSGTYKHLIGKYSFVNSIINILENKKENKIQNKLENNFPQLSNVQLRNYSQTYFNHTESFSVASNLHSSIKNKEEFDSVYRQLDVTKYNFSEAYQELLSHLDKVSFVSIDFEFSGLELSEKNVYNESIDSRYEKLRKSVQRFAPLQVGICLWEWKNGPLKNKDLESKIQDRKQNNIESKSDIQQNIIINSNGDNSSSSDTSNTTSIANNFSFEGFPWLYNRNICLQNGGNESTYIVRSFNFNIFPKYSKVFLVESSTLEFLVRNNFDFNKMIREGIPFLNEVQILLKKQEIDQISKPNLQKYTVEKGNPSYETILYYLEEVQKFRSGASLGEMKQIYIDRSFHTPIIIQEIMKRYNDIYPEYAKEGIILHYVNEEIKLNIIERIKKEKYTELEEQQGITRVINAIIEKKIPLVCHNGLFDLLYLYHHFVRPLPLLVSEFKTRLNELFPIIYDTKYIASASKHYGEFFQDRTITDLSLGSLYDTAWKKTIKASISSIEEQTNSTSNENYMKEKQPNVLNFPFNNYSIAIQSPKQFGNCTNRKVAHEAGYDAFMTGVVHLQLLNNLQRSFPDNMEEFTPIILKNRIPVASSEYFFDLETP